MNTPSPKVLQELRKDIDRRGMVVAVPPAKGPDEPYGVIAYSVGLWHTLGIPEVIMPEIPIWHFKRTGALAKEIIRQYFMACQYGQLGPELIPGEHFNLPGVKVPIAYRSPEDLRPSEHMPLAVAFYGSPKVLVVQLFWGDENGHMPWELGCDPFVVEAQRLK